MTHFAAADADDAHDFAGRAQAALQALAGRPGYQRGTLARSTDDPSAWLLLTEWESVGAYRRALGGYDVKLAATPLFASAVPDLPAGFEELVDVAAGGAVSSRASDRASDG